MKQHRWVHDFFGGVPNPYSTLPGIPYFYIFAWVGMAAAIARWRRLGPVHLAWIVTMLGVWYISVMVAVTNGRFRFVYEPFCLIYLLLLVDCLLEWCTSKQPREQPVPCDL
jgi:hypothetical protein